MRTDAVTLEEKRLEKVTSLESYTQFHERHRIFPALFENRNHKKIIDLSAGVGVVATRIKEQYSAELICNDISPKCLALLKEQGHKTVSFDLDNPEKPFPLHDSEMDAVISLATIEHLIHVDFFIEQIHRILKDNGCLYISAPNYNGMIYILNLLRNGKAFHDPMHPVDRYEFFGHVRYFTYQTMKEFIESYGFILDSVYLARPQSSSKFLKLQQQSRWKAKMVRFSMTAMYHVASPRWASEPVLCFRKGKQAGTLKTRKIIL